MSERELTVEARALIRLRETPCPFLPSAYATDDVDTGPWQDYFGAGLSARQWSQAAHRLVGLMLAFGNPGAMHVSYGVTTLGIQVAKALKELGPDEWLKLASGKVFLSHSFKDNEFCRSLDFDLQRLGFETWFDLNNLLAGDSIPAKIDDGLNRSDFVIIVYTKNSAQSRWVKKEYESALYLEDVGKIRRVVVVKIDDVELPPLLRARRYISFVSLERYTKEYESGVNEIVSALRRS